MQQSWIRTVLNDCCLWQLISLCCREALQLVRYPNDRRRGETARVLCVCHAAGRRYFREFLRSEFSEENLLFWLACEDLKKDDDTQRVEDKARLIYEDYISIISPTEVRQLILVLAASRIMWGTVSNNLHLFISFKMTIFGNNRCKNRYEQDGKALNVHLQRPSWALTKLQYESTGQTEFRQKLSDLAGGAVSDVFILGAFCVTSEASIPIYCWRQMRQRHFFWRILLKV